MLELVPITNYELDNLCATLAQTQYIYYPVATSFFNDLYHTGCRPMELLKMNLWNYISDDEIILQPLKGNFPRYFTSSQLSKSFLFALKNNIEPYNGLSLRQLTSVLKKIIPVIKIQTVDKSAIDYMFRYNRVKSLYDAGQPLEAITETFGWSSVSLASGYAFRTLYRMGPLPPPLADYIVDSEGNYLSDNEENLLIA